MASKDKLLANVRPNGQEDAPQFRLDIDAAEGSLARAVDGRRQRDTARVAWGGRYIDDFIDRGRVKHVIVQADAPFRMEPEDFNRWYVRNAQGQHGVGRLVRELAWTYGSPAARALQRRCRRGDQRRGRARRELRRPR